MALRPYQQDLKDKIFASWEGGAQNVCAVLPTGGGKTILFADIIRNHVGGVCAIAHRQELVGQISLALAREGVYHNIIAPVDVIGFCCSQHQNELGQRFYREGSAVAVAGVDTLIRRVDALRHWAYGVTMWVQDECHHTLSDNKWGTAAKMFPNAKGLGVTATPCRADGKGLGRHADGIMDDLVVGVQMRDLIDAGYLTDYRIFAPPTDIDIERIKISKATGDFSEPSMRKVVSDSHIVGDVVDHYLKIAKGKSGITFAVDVQSAKDIALQFNKNGIPAEALSAKTPDRIRAEMIRRFKVGDLLQLVNVGLFTEGFDVPGIEVVSMARPTQSYSLFAQKFGRALRTKEGKSHAIIIDHVGNTLRHGLPDATRQWTLNAKDKRSTAPDDTIPTKTCPDCTSVYEAIHKHCPFCGFAALPVARSTPAQVDGDLMELTPDALKRLRDMAHQRKDADEIRKNATNVKEYSIANSVKRQNEIRDKLKSTIDLWGEWQRYNGLDERQAFRLFYQRYGVDVLSAQSLDSAQVLTLTDKLNNSMK